mmetsp:Transcript_20869/g.57880  ORF Transcript_20869/g.57880 Transcript_20869/m.57880 type:complete len:324 (+) Transcript_20869:417-1388(+)
MGKSLHWGAKVVVRCALIEVGDPRGVDVGVLFDLILKEGFVIDTGTGEVAPSLVEVAAIALHHGGDLSVKGLYVEHKLPQRLIHELLVVQHRGHLPNGPLAGKPALPLDTEGVEDREDLLPLVQQVLQLRPVRPAQAQRPDLPLKLTDDESGPPAQVDLCQGSVRVDVVPNIEDVAAFHAQGVLHLFGRAATEDSSAVSLDDRPHQAVLCHHLVHASLQDAAMGEEVGLPRLDNHHVKQVLPDHFAWEVAVEGILHQLLSVLQVAVGDHHQLDPSVVLIQESGGSVWIQLNEPVRILKDALLELSFNLSLNLCLSDQIVQCLI